MNRCLILASLFCFSLFGKASVLNLAVKADSVYLFSYAQPQNNGHFGLQFAWSRDKQQWHPIGDDYGFVKSDYGRWGSQKRMIEPFLLKGPGNEWECVWQLNSEECVFAHASSKDLIGWGRQSYPMLHTGGNCLQPVIQYDRNSNKYRILYQDAGGKYYCLTTGDFKTYSRPVATQANQYEFIQAVVHLPKGDFKGQLHRVAWEEVAALQKNYELYLMHKSQNEASTATDNSRFAGLKPITAKLTLFPERTKEISDMLVGAFFEDLNYAADGGLYAELIQNRDFEYQLSDKLGQDPSWSALHSWELQGKNTTLSLDSIGPVDQNNPHFVVLNTKSPGACLNNKGYDGIAVVKGATYNLSLFAKKISSRGKQQHIRVRLVRPNGVVLASATLLLKGGGWQKYRAKLLSTSTENDCKLQIKPLDKGRINLDMISLFPEKTFKGHRNGLRADLAQAIADLHPKFLRFPGGCLAHGDGIGNIYRWKNTIGPLESRKPQRNLWGYHQSVGLGYFEYFQFCEDIGARPVPVIAAGVPCQNSATGGGGQQGGIPMEQMAAYIQDLLDLIEYANGPINTKWGKKRAEGGHPAPFHLEYIGIGNEDLISDIFEERFTMIYEAIKKTHPEITVIGTVGPTFEGTDYTEGWGIADKLGVPIVDEHYYQSPGWFIHHQDFYDKYDRSKSKVYLGEYAAHLPGKPNNLETALSEALYLTSLERNGDVVHMASYAPLLAKSGHTQWNPDLIYFDNTAVMTSTGYEVQKLFGGNEGTEYIPGQMSLSNEIEDVRLRIAYSMIKDTTTGDMILKLVNLLPVEVQLNTDLSPWIGVEGITGIKSSLTGMPTDKKGKTVTGIIEVGAHEKLQLPAYSLTCIRFKGNK